MCVCVREGVRDCEGEGSVGRMSEESQPHRLETGDKLNGLGQKRKRPRKVKRGRAG